MKPLKLGLITYGLDRPLTGISRYTVELVRTLSTGEFDVALNLLTAGEPRALKNMNSYRAKPLHGCGRLPGFVTLGNAMIYTASRAERLDVVHDPTGVTPFLLGAASAKTVVTVHDVIPYCLPGNSTVLDALIYHYWLPRVIGRVDAILTPSDASRRDIFQFLQVDPQKVYVVPSAANAHFRPIARDLVRRELEKRFGLMGRYILYVGAFIARKNLKRALQAFAWVRAERNDIDFVMVGPREGQSTIKAVLPLLGLADAVRLIDSVTDAELAMLYNGAELFFFFSLYEGFGLPVLEAMSCGTPVICSDTSALPELAGEAALLVNPSDIEAMGQAILRVLNEPALRGTLGERGMARAQAFSWKQTAVATCRIYHHVLG